MTSRTVADPEPQAPSCPAREVLDRVGDKWSVYVIHALGGEVRRFSELRRGIEGISQRMLTVTLRGLERDGIVTRTVYPVVPPRVEYALTPLGETLLSTVCALATWAEEHAADIEQARREYDRGPDVSARAQERAEGVDLPAASRSSLSA